LYLFAALLLLAAPACGGVGASEEDEQPLKLVDLYPQRGATDVPVDVTVFAVFSDDVFTEEECDSSENVNDATFELSACPEDGDPVDVTGTVCCSKFYEDDGETLIRVETTTAVFQPQEQLIPATRYCIHIDGSISGQVKDALGTDIDGSISGQVKDALGTDIDSSFTTVGQ